MARAHLGAVVQHLQRLVSPMLGDEPTDSQLLDRFITWRDEAAFEALVRRHGPLVLRVCRRVLFDPHAAEDAFQATFLVLARKAETIGKRESLASWLYGAAYRIARKARLSDSRRQVRETKAAGLTRGEEGDEAPANTDLKPILDEELERLSARHRAPLVLCYLQGKTYGQAARELGWSEGSMSRRLAQARDVLRERLLRRGVMLSTASVAGLLTSDVVASVPARLIEATVKGTMLTRLSASVLALAETGVRETSLLRMKVAAVMFLTLGTAVTGVSVHEGPRPDDPSLAVATRLPKPGHTLADIGLSEVDPAIQEENNEEESEELSQPPVPSVDLDAILTEELPLQPASYQRRQFLTEIELRRQLALLPEVGLDAGAIREIVQQTRLLPPGQPPALVADLVARRPALIGLPLRPATDHMLGADDSLNLHLRSRDLRDVVSHTLEQDRAGRLLPDTLRKNFRTSRAFRESFRHPITVTALMQQLSARDVAVREVLVEQLARIEHARSTEALAQLAVFDLSPRIRGLAVQVLTTRPASDVRPVLLAALRYPWAPAADHAAEAMAAPQDREAIPALTALLNEAAPEAPLYDAGRETYVVREVVRIDHGRNCLLCHGASLGSGDLLRARVPGQKETAVRADLTYLRPDFAAPLDGKRTEAGTEMTRFDYVLRTRPVSFAEGTAKTVQRSATHPQREAVRFALRELSLR